MIFRQVKTNKKEYLELLLLGDEQEDMIDRYLERGEMFILRGQDGETRAVAVVTDEGGGVCEVKNIAVDPVYQRRGLGRRMLDELAAFFQGRFSVMQAGTGECPAAISFYERCGFTYSHRLEGFFTKQYDHPIWEDGVLLADMVYFRRTL